MYCLVVSEQVGSLAELAELHDDMKRHLRVHGFFELSMAEGWFTPGSESEEPDHAVYMELVPDEPKWSVRMVVSGVVWNGVNGSIYHAVNVASGAAGYFFGYGLGMAKKMRGDAYELPGSMVPEWLWGWGGG